MKAGIILKKIVFFDIDGTLLDHEKKLPASTKKAIKDLQDKGVFVAIATGRAPFMFEPLREELGIDSFVSFNGQFVVFENEVVYRNPLPRAELTRIHQQAENEQKAMVFMNDKTMKASVKGCERVTEALGTLRFPYPECSPEFYQENDIYQALLFTTVEEDQQIIHQYDDLHFIRWHEFSTDVLPAGGSKAEGIKRFIERTDFRMEDVYAFGDGLNDIEMLGTVGHGIAMGNALDEVKKHAEFVTKNVDDSGILYGLKHMGLL